MVFAMSDRTDARPQAVTSFPHRRAGHCGSGALRDLLEHRALDFGDGPLSEGEVFGLGAGLGFLYVEAPSMRPPIYLVGRTAGYELDIAANLGFGVDVCRTVDPEEGHEMLRRALREDGPTMVWADIMHLDYLRVKLHNTRHDIVIVDLDEHDEIAYIADNDRDDIQACSLSSLRRARNSDAFPGPNENAMFRYKWPARLPAPRDAVRSAVESAVSNMNGGGRPLAGLEGMAGLVGVDRFVKAYTLWPQTLGEALPTALGALCIFITKAGTGGSMFRSLHCEFLTKAAARLDSRSLADAAETYNALAESWVELARLAAAGDHRSGVEVAHDIATLEHAGVQAMTAALDAI